MAESITIKPGKLPNLTGEIPSIVDAITMCQQIGEAYRDLDATMQGILAATWQAHHAGDADAVEQVRVALALSDMPSGPAIKASAALSSVARVQPATEGKPLAKEARSFAADAVADMFEHETKKRKERRDARRAKTVEAKKAQKAAQEELAALKNDAENAGDVDSGEVLANAFVGPDGTVLDTFDAHEMEIVSQLIHAMRALRPDEHSQLVLAAEFCIREMEATAGTREGIRKEDNLAKRRIP